MLRSVYAILIFSLGFNHCLMAEDFAGIKSVVGNRVDPHKKMTFKRATINVNGLYTYITESLSDKPIAKADQIFEEIDVLADEIGALLFHSTTNRQHNPEEPRLEQLDPQALKKGKDAFGIRQATPSDARTLDKMSYLLGFYGAYLFANNRYEGADYLDANSIVKLLHLDKYNVNLGLSKEGYLSHASHMLRLLSIGAGDTVQPNWNSTEFDDSWVNKKFIKGYKQNAKNGALGFRKILKKTLNENITGLKKDEEHIMPTVKQQNAKDLQQGMEAINKELTKEPELESMEGATAELRKATQRKWQTNINSAIKQVEESSPKLDEFIADMEVKAAKMSELQLKSIKANRTLKGPQDLANRAKSIKRIYSMITSAGLENYAARLIHQPIKYATESIKRIAVYFPDFIKAHGSLVKFLQDNEKLIMMDVFPMPQRMRVDADGRLIISGIDEQLFNETYPHGRPLQERIASVDNSNIYALLPKVLFDHTSTKHMELYHFYAPNLSSYLPMLRNLKTIKFHKVFLQTDDLLEALLHMPELEQVTFEKCDDLDKTKIREFADQYELQVKFTSNK